MPVWHELTRPWREDGRLRVVGVVQEQHPARCRLFAQWKELDFPLLWDPFDLTGSQVVPSFVAVDEHGIVRHVNPSSEVFEEFLGRSFAPGTGAIPDDGTTGRAAEAAFAGAGGAALETLLFSRGAETPDWGRGSPLDEAVETLVRRAAKRPDEAMLRFRAGVALRMRHDSPARRPGDFQAALDHWSRALALEPNQYIWRRRIQQYGPRMDKPYNFYGWVDEARRDLRYRGEDPVELEAGLTEAERAFPRRAFAEPSRDEPDPGGSIRREPDLVEVETAVAWATAGERVASVHLILRPRAEQDAHWNDEGGSTRIWIGTGGLPEGWQASERLLVRQPDGPAVSSEPRRFQLELALPPGFEGGVLPCHVLYYACEGESGRCLYLRRDLTVEIPPPPP